MADDANQMPVQVTAEERTHPAIQKLARACIALARWRRTQPAPQGEPNMAQPTNREEVPSTSLPTGDRGQADG